MTYCCVRGASLDPREALKAPGLAAFSAARQLSGWGTSATNTDQLFHGSLVTDTKHLDTFKSVLCECVVGQVMSIAGAWEPNDVSQG